MRITKDQIKQARDALKLSQEDFGAKLGLSGSAISMLERGDTSPITVSDEDPQHLAWEALLSGKHEAIATLPTPLAAWLKTIRIKRGLSVSKFAEASRTSEHQIRAIERGQQTPLPATFRRIEDALGEQFPGTVTTTTEVSPSIPGIGRLEDFNPHNANDRPICAGVYVLYDISDRPVYIGESKNIRQRLRQHEEKFWFKRPLVEYAAYLQIEDDSLRKGIEKILINFLRSNAVLNRQYVSRN